MPPGGGDGEEVGIAIDDDDVDAPAVLLRAPDQAAGEVAAPAAHVDDEQAPRGQDTPGHPADRGEGQRVAAEPGVEAIDVGQRRVPVRGGHGSIETLQLAFRPMHYCSPHLTARLAARRASARTTLAPSHRSPRRAARLSSHDSRPISPLASPRGAPQLARLSPHLTARLAARRASARTTLAPSHRSPRRAARLSSHDLRPISPLASPPGAPQLARLSPHLTARLAARRASARTAISTSSAARLRRRSRGRGRPSTPSRRAPATPSAASLRGRRGSWPTTCCRTTAARCACAPSARP